MKTQTSFTRVLQFSIFSSAILTLALPLSAADPVATSVAGVRVVSQQYGEDFGGISAFNAKKGTALALLLKSTEGAIIAVDSRDSKLDAFTDDKGNSLLVKDKFGRGGIGSFPKISDDGQVAIVEIEGAGVPADGCTKLKAKGLLKVTVASEKKTAKSKAVKLAKDSPVTVGDYAFILKKVGKPDFGDNALQIDLEIKQRIDEIAEFKFYKPDGSEIESKGAGSSSGGFGNRWTVTKSFSFKEKVASVIVEVVYWSNKKVIAVPFDISAGVGG